MNAVRLAWKRLPEKERDELAGPPWPMHAGPLDQALHRARAELARRGIMVERVGRSLVVSVVGEDGYVTG